MKPRTELIIEESAKAFDLEPERMRDTSDRVTPLVRARVVAVYVMRQNMMMAFCAIAECVGFSHARQAQTSWMQGASLVASGEQWMLDAVQAVEQRLRSPGNGEPGLGELEKLCSDLEQSQRHHQALSRRLRRLFGRDVLKRGFPVKLGGLPFLVRDVVILREGATPGSVREDVALRIEPNPEAVYTAEAGLLLDGKCSVSAGEVRMEELKDVEVE